MRNPPTQLLGKLDYSLESALDNFATSGTENIDPWQRSLGRHKHANKHYANSGQSGAMPYPCTGAMPCLSGQSGTDTET